MSVSEVIEEIRALSQAEKHHLWRELNKLVGEEPVELRLQRALAGDGLLSEIKMPPAARPGQKEPDPINTKGKPLSQVIIEERR